MYVYEVIAAYKPEDTTKAKVLLYLRKSGGAIAHPAPLVPTPMYMTLLHGSFPEAVRHFYELQTTLGGSSFFFVLRALRNAADIDSF